MQRGSVDRFRREFVSIFASVTDWEAYRIKTKLLLFIFLLYPLISLVVLALHVLGTLSQTFFFGYLWVELCMSLGFFSFILWDDFRTTRTDIDRILFYRPSLRRALRASGHREWEE
jgi:hypothetical protein